MSSVAQNVPLKMDTKNLQIQTLTVERLIQPLILQVTTLVNCVRDPSKNKKGRSKRASVLLASVEEATNNLIEKGNQIVEDSTFLKEELTKAVQDVRRESEAMRVTAKEFTDDPCVLAKREGVVGAARGLLAAVTRLLVLADALDVMYLLQHLMAVQKSFALLSNVTNEDELSKAYSKFGQDLAQLDLLTQKRQRKGAPLTTAAQMQRWALFLGGHNYKFEFKRTTSHGNAVGLHCLPLEKETPEKLITWTLYLMYSPS